jgi:hypothetical protein
VPELYEQFAKFSKSEIQHFRKLEQQRKISKLDEALRPRHNESQPATLSLCTTLTLMDVDHRRIGRRINGHPHNKQTRGPLTRDVINTAKGEDQRTGIAVMAEACI